MSGLNTDEFEGIEIVSVRRLAAYVHKKLGADKKLQRVAIQGEVSKPTTAGVGHVYFKLVEANLSLDCFLHGAIAKRLPVLKAGDSVIAYGQVTTYVGRSSTYQLDVKLFRYAGLGQLFLRREELRRVLQSEGLFDDSRRRKIPRFPGYVALVGSRTADGTRDFQTKATLRAPQVRVRLFETPVQGDVSDQIVDAIARASRSNPDYIVITRGGGSPEDLLVFSEERLVRAVASCPIPIVSAIGHEGDVPLVDHVADLRVMTPTEAAELLPAREALQGSIDALAVRLDRGLNGVVQFRRHLLERVEYRSPLSDAKLVLVPSERRLDELSSTLLDNVRSMVARRRDSLYQIERQYLSLSPVAHASEKRRRLASLASDLRALFQRTSECRRARLMNAERSLGSLSPVARIATWGGRLLVLRRALQPSLDRFLVVERSSVSALAGGLEAAIRPLFSNKAELLMDQQAALASASRLVLVDRLARVHDLEDRMALASPQHRVGRLSETLAGLSMRLYLAERSTIAQHTSRAKVMAARLEGKNPDAVLQSGYAIVTIAGKGVLRNAHDAPKGTRLRIRVSRGELSARVEEEE